jgi:15-cis-phytoene synthase
MTIEASLKACEEAVRRADPDRYFSALFVESERRPVIFALYALNHELAHIGETVREPMMGEIRLEWWREAITEARDGHPRPHDVVRGIAELFARAGPPIELFETMIDARRFDVSADVFPDMRSLVSYVDATSGTLMRIASQTLIDSDRASDIAHEAGVAYGIAGLLRALPYWAARRRLILPLDVLREQGIAKEAVLSGKSDKQKLKAAMGRVAAVAEAHYASARARRLPEPSLSAFLPATLVPFYLARIQSPRVDPLRDLVDMPAYRKQLIFLRASFTGRI